MRLQLNTSVSNAADTAPASATDNVATRGPRGGDSGGLRDSISVSGASSALNAFSVDRNARIQQLSATVQSGNYQVTSAAISSAIVGNAASSGGR